MSYFVNCSNHPSCNWLSNQISEASKYGKIVDVLFPSIPTQASDEELDEIVMQTLYEILKYQPCVVMCMGEFVATYRLVKCLKKQNIKVIATRSERKSIEFIDECGVVQKKSSFVFKGFREY